MTSRQIIETIRCFADLPRLALALGCSLRWEEIPVAFWEARPGDRPCCRQSALLGYQGELPWYGVETPDVARALRRLARLLHRRGEPAGVLAIDPVGRTLAMTVAFEGFPVLGLHPASDDRMVDSCLRRITALPPGGRLTTAGRLAGILSTESLGTRFFTAFERVLESMAESLKGCRAADRKSLALLQLNRVLFLYFIQSKGWLAGRSDFLSFQVDYCLSRGRQLDRSFFRPLFFGTLNRPQPERSRAARFFGAIPFLNGGLFEPHPIERNWKGSIPNPVWRDAFDHLFERFQFTSAEGAGVAIAPDMLGRVFEGVMARDERRRSGTFYTPPALVRALFEECLVTLISEEGAIAASTATQRLAVRDPSIHPILESITVLDPAVGSGAFLLCALERLAELATVSQQEMAVARRRILQRNLFGVDLDPMAVRLTELRLWLALIAHDDSAGPVAPLPNLDCLVRQGDSLTDPLGLIARLPFRAAAMGTSLADLRRAFSASTGSAKRERGRALREAESAAMRECLTIAERSVARSIAETLERARSQDLFGHRRGLDAASSRTLGELRRRLTEIRQARRRLNREGEIGWFQYESHFADVFSGKGGFDIVVGNPPWIRAEKLPPMVREQLSHRYHWWRGAGGRAGGYRHQPDIAVAFLERAHELVRPQGIVGLLLPSKVATAAYGTAARRALARGLTLHAVCDLESTFPAAFDATVYPMALVSSKRRPDPDHGVRLSLGGFEGPSASQQDWNGGPWVLRRPGAAAILRELTGRFPHLAEAYPIQLGIKTGANEIFLDPPPTVEQCLIAQAFRGRDLVPFGIARTVSLLWPYSEEGTLLPELPPGARRYLASQKDRLTARTDFIGGHYWTLFRTGAASAIPRVVWADLARGLRATVLDSTDRRIPLNTTYVLRCPAREQALVVAAWLNSTWARALARLQADSASSGFARFNASTVGGLPLPDSLRRDQGLAAWAARALGRSFSQAELDELTADHLDLTPAARRILASAT